MAQPMDEAVPPPASYCGPRPPEWPRTISILIIPPQMLQITVKTFPKQSATPKEQLKLPSLPQELTTKIFENLRLLDRISLALTCKDLAAFSTILGVLTLDTSHLPTRALIRHDDFVHVEASRLPVYQHRVTGHWQVRRGAYFRLVASGHHHYGSYAGPNSCIDRFLNRSIKKRFVEEGYWYTEGMSELVAAKRDIVVHDYVSWLNSKRISFLTLKYRKPGGGRT